MFKPTGTVAAAPAFWHKADEAGPDAPTIEAPG